MLEKGSDMPDGLGGGVAGSHGFGQISKGFFRIAHHPLGGEREGNGATEFGHALRLFCGEKTAYEIQRYERGVVGHPELLELNARLFETDKPARVFTLLDLQCAEG